MRHVHVHVIAPDHHINETLAGRSPEATMRRAMGSRRYRLVDQPGQRTQLGPACWETMIVRTDRYGTHVEGKVVVTEQED